MNSKTSVIVTSTFQIHLMPEDRKLTQITAKFDKEMVDWFRRQGRGYQSRMNAVLKSYYEANKGN